MKKTKRMSTFILTIMLILFANIGVYAITNEDITGQEPSLAYTYTSSVKSTISLSGKTASCKSAIIGNGTVTKIIVTQTLQKYTGTNWTNVTSWSKTYASNSAVYSNSKSSLTAGTYRTRTVAKVYKGTSYETVSANSSNVRVA